MWILLGCGADNRGPGWVHHDRTAHSAHVQVAHDLEMRPWPWADGAAEVIEARMVLEHLRDTVAFMDECWRVLAAEGRLLVTVPHWRSENAWRDPTHLRAFHPDAFQYFDPTTPWGEVYGRFYTQRFWRLARCMMPTPDSIEALLLKRSEWPPA